MEVIGLTGGVGGGKSLVRKILKEEYHAWVIDTDSLGHEVIEPGTEGFERVVSYFGSEILTEPEAAGEEKRVDRKKLAAIVFSDSEKLKWLNNLIHPAVIERVRELLKEGLAQKKYPYAVLETALMYESGLDALCDQVWYVYAPESLRRKRLMEERGYSGERVQAILKQQKSEEEFRVKAEKVLDNSGSEEELRQQVARLLEVKRA